MKHFDIMVIHWKIHFLGGGGHGKWIYRGELPKKRGGGGGVWGVYNVLWLASCIFKGVIKMKFFFAK